MNTSLLRLFCSLCAVFLLTQCVAYDDPYYGGGYSSSYYDGPSYYSRPSYGYYTGSSFFGGPSYYGSSRQLCPSCHRNPCCCRNHSSHSHSSSNRNSSSRSSSNHSAHSHSSNRDIGFIGQSHGQSARSSSSSSSQRRDSDGDKLYRYGSRDKDMPQGNHTKEWYKDRGYDLGKLKPSR